MLALMRCRRVGLQILPGLHAAVLLGLDVVEQDVLLPVDGRRRHVEHQPGDEAAHLLQVLAAGLVARDPEGLVDDGGTTTVRTVPSRLSDHRQRQQMAAGQQRRRSAPRPRLRRRMS